MRSNCLRRLHKRRFCSLSIICSELSGDPDVFRG